jgi:hypothetical protein
VPVPFYSLKRCLGPWTYIVDAGTDKVEVACRRHTYLSLLKKPLVDISGDFMTPADPIIERIVFSEAYFRVCIPHVKSSDELHPCASWSLSYPHRIVAARKMGLQGGELLSKALCSMS